MLFSLIAMQTTGPNDPIVKPPDDLSFGGFYSKCVYFQGLAIIGSSVVDDRAFHHIIDTFTKMMARCPKGTMASLVSNHCHYSIIGAKQGQVDLPEYADLRNDPNTDWNKRARGLGGRVCSGGEENILEFPDDRYKGESIYIHEFSHTLDDWAFSKIDPKFLPMIKDAYSHAMETGLWRRTYLETNRFEYFAEGVQMYFDCARTSVHANGVHNWVGNRAGLKLYDPKLYAVVDREFGGNPWRYEGSYNKTKMALPEHPEIP